MAGISCISGILSRRGYSHYATYWRDESPRSACRHCRVQNNMSVHGVVAHCSPTHPLVSAWIHSWPQPSIISSWRATAHRRYLRIAGRLAVPCSLYHTLRASLATQRARRCQFCTGRRYPPRALQTNPTLSTPRTGDPSHVLYEPLVAPPPPPPCSYPFFFQASSNAELRGHHHNVSGRPPSGPSTLHRRQY